jgi:hypothetical protein
MNKIDKALALQSRLITNEMRGIYPDTLQEFADLVRADEREACAKVCEKWTPTDVDGFCPAAAAIRARGQA